MVPVKSNENKMYSILKKNNTFTEERLYTICKRYQMQAPVINDIVFLCLKPQPFWIMCAD